MAACNIPAGNTEERRNCVLGLGQTSLFSCAEPNANELKQRLFFIYIRFGA